MKFKLFLISSSVLLLFCCKTIETQSFGKKLTLKLENSSSKELRIFRIFSTENSELIIPENGNIYRINIPPMSGGYKTILGFKYHIHNPQDYKVIRIILGKKMLKELSTNEIQALPKTEDGIYEFKL